MSRPRYVSTDPSPFDDDEVDAGLVHATKHPSRRSDHRLDPAKNLVDDELERARVAPRSRGGITGAQGHPDVSRSSRTCPGGTRKLRLLVV